MLKSAINLIDNWFFIWLITTIVSLALIPTFGMWWQKSGKTDRERKSVLIMLGKMSVSLFVIALLTLLFSTAINVLQAII